MALPARATCLLIAALALLPLADALSLQARPGAAPFAVPQQGRSPDLPASHAPDAVVVAIEDEYWWNSGGTRTHDVVVPVSPTGTWDRVVLSYRQYPNSDPAQADPWDRLCSAAIAGVEVLHCTTPRADFTLRKDITEYASLLPPGATVPVTADTGSYDEPQYYQGGQHVHVELEFYADEPTTAAVNPAAAQVLPAWYDVGMCAAGTPITRAVTFPATPPAQATLEVYLSGHGDSEDWFLNAAAHTGPNAGVSGYPLFHVYLDGQELAQVQPMPYVYANAGFYGGDATVHPLVYWTAQKALNQAGISYGVGQVPSYRLQMLPDQLPLLAGTHEVSLVGYGGTCYWPTSLNFLIG